MAQSPAGGENATNHLASFSTAIDSYEHRIGQATRAVAGHLLPLLTTLPPNPIILDNACGTGAVTDKVLQSIPSARIYAADAVPPMVNIMKALVEAKSEWKSKVANVAVMNGQDLQYEDNFFDASIMNFAIYFFPDPVQGIREVYRTLKPGGVGLITLWKEFGFAPILWEVQEKVKPANPLQSLPLMDVWTSGELLKKTIEQGGFKDFDMVTVEERLWGTDAKDLQDVLLENFGAMVAKNWTDEEKSKLGAATAEVLKDNGPKFCVQHGEKIGVPMIAWVAVCRK